MCRNLGTAREDPSEAAAFRRPIDDSLRIPTDVIDLRRVSSLSRRHDKCSFYFVMPHASRPLRLAFAADETWSKTLLVCGIVSSLLYGAMIGAIRFEGYSRISQVPSELTAIGAPTRPLWMLLGAVYTVLVTAFGWGVWKAAGRSRALRIVGGLILAYGSLGLLWPSAAMHQRDVLAAGGGTLSDTAHVVLGGVTVFLMFLAIGFGATAFGKRFRLYSIASIVVLLAFGGLTFLEAPRLQANLPTPWIGLWSASTSACSCSGSWRWRPRCCGQEHRRRDAMSQPSPFKTPQGEARFVAAYDDALKLWPVPYEQLDIPTRFGMTHIVAAGPKHARLGGFHGCSRREGCSARAELDVSRNEAFSNATRHVTCRPESVVRRRIAGVARTGAVAHGRPRSVVRRGNGNGSRMSADSWFRRRTGSGLPS